MGVTSIVTSIVTSLSNMSEDEASSETDNQEPEPAPAPPSGPRNVLMTDEFPGITKLDDGLWKIDGAPNWRRVPGFPIYATGQPKKEDVDKCVEQVVKKYDEQKSVLCDDLAGHIVLDEAFEMNNIENKMASELKKADEFKFYKDQVGEKDVEKFPPVVEDKGRPDSVVTLNEVFSAASKKQPKLEYKRIPLNLNSAGREESYDQIVRLLKGHGSAVPVIFNCQGGYTRSSTAAVMAAIIKEAQLEAEFNKMKGVVPEEIVEELRTKKLKPPVKPRDPKDNALMLGEFPVVMDLIKELPEAGEAKQQVDRLIDVLGPPAGVEHIREAIIMDKMQYDVASDQYRDVLKTRIMDQVEKYFMFIVFSLYCRKVGAAGFNQSFGKWLDSTNYRDLIAAGKGRLEWERKIPEEKINDLKEMLKADNFNEHLPEVINKINQLSYKMFSDLPRGDQKCKSMRKLAGRTLIDVLPPKLEVYLEGKFGDLNKVPDFYDMVGQLSFYGKMPEEVPSI